MGVGSLLMALGWVIAIMLFICLLPPIPNRKPTRLTPKLSPMKRDSIIYPDDEDHLCADMREWDRHLVSLGMLPIYTSNPELVGPIIQTPKEVERVGLWIITEYRGIEILPQSKVQEAARSSHEEQWLQVQ
jgi:hypothetical protein